MASNRDNIIFEKTSFLQGSNSPFIKELYLQYLENPKAIPKSWKVFFDALNENQEIILKEIEGRLQDFVVDKHKNLIPLAPAVFNYNDMDWKGIDETLRRITSTNWSFKPTNQRHN